MSNRLADIDDRNQDLKALLNEKRGEAAATARAFLEKLTLSWLYHENALEGLVLSAEELTAALGPGAPVAEAGVASLQREIRNHKAAIDRVRAEAKRRTRYQVSFIKQLAETLVKGLPGKAGPALRRELPVHRNYFHDIAEAAQIGPGLVQLCDFMNGAEFREQHPIRQAALAHHRFMRLFPFAEESGPVGRLWMNLVLLRGGFLPAVLHAIDRQRYYDSLRHPPQVFTDFLIDSVDNGLTNAFQFFARAAKQGLVEEIG